MGIVIFEGNCFQEAKRIFWLEKKEKKKKSPAFRFYTCQDLQAVVVGAAFMLGMSSVLQGPGHKVERKWSVP